MLLLPIDFSLSSFIFLNSNLTTEYTFNFFAMVTHNKTFQTGYICGVLIDAGIQKQPVQWSKAPAWLRSQYMERNYHYVNSSQGPASTHSKQKNIDHMLAFIRSVNENNCANRALFQPDDLILQGDIGFGAEAQFENEARMALRLANFLSSFLQVGF